MKKILFTLNKILVLAALFLPLQSFAARVFFSAPHVQFEKHEQFLVDVYVNTEGVLVNAVDGAIVFPSEVLTLKEIRTANSFINFWIDKPKAEGNTLSFSGITPGGVNSKKVVALSLVFEAMTSGKGTLTVKDFHALKNDGDGTELKVTKTPLTLSVSSRSTTTQTLAQTDTDIPENFVPVLGRDPSLFDGKYFVAFDTQDKGVGINHYEVREGMWGKFMTAESPYVLTSQSLTSKLYVKAVDNAENERIVVYTEPRVWMYEIGVLLVIILCIYCVRFFFKNKSWRKFIH